LLSGDVLAIDDPVLLQRFGALAGEGHALTPAFPYHLMVSGLTLATMCGLSV
jgi:hypothetical protein